HGRYATHCRYPTTWRRATLLRRWKGRPVIRDRRPSLPIAALLTVPLLIASGAPLAEPPASQPSAPAHHAGVLRYHVDIDAPKTVRDTLAASVDLVRWQSYDQMTEGLFDALTTNAIDQAKEAAATEGYFSADVAVDVDRNASPIAV